MMDKRIIFIRPDGGVSIVVPDLHFIEEQTAAGLTEDEVLALVQARTVPLDATDIEIIPASQVPSDRVRRDAFKDTWKGRRNATAPQ